MFGMKGIFVSANGLIQVHYGPLVLYTLTFFYTLTSPNIHQSARIRSRMSSIMGLIRSEQSELPAFELENLFCLTVYNVVISTKFSVIVCDRTISDVFNYGLNRTGKTAVICP